MQGDSTKDTFVALEDEHDSAAPTSDAGRPTGPGPRSRWTGRRASAVGAGIALLAAAGVYALVDERGRQSDLDRHADVPGVVGSLAEPLEEAWRGDLGTGAVELADLLLVSRSSADAGLLSAREVATGEERWGIEDAGGPGGQCVTDLEGPQGPLLLCALSVPDEQNSLGMPFFDWHLVDPATGGARRYSDTVGDAPMYGQALTPIDGDLLHVDPGDGASRTLVRSDLTAEEVLWRAPLPVLSDDPAASRVNGLVASGDLVVVLSAAGTVLLDGDGTVLEVLAREAALGAAPERLPLLASEEHGVGLWTDPTTGQWFAPDGTPTATLDGRPIEIDVVGGSERVAVLSRDDLLVAVDVTTGAELWEVPAQGRARVLLDGRLVVSERDRLAALDVRTGETLWEVRLDASVEGATSPTLTDGARLGLAGQQDGRTTMTTFDLATGREVWTARLPEGTRSLQRIGRAVVAIAPVRGGEDFVVLR